MITPLFESTYGGTGSLLTLDEPSKAKPGSPVSVFDLAQQAGLQEVVLCDSRIDGYLAAYKVATKLKMKLCFGLKMTICANMLDKTPESERTESKVVVFARNTQGYSDLIRIHNRATNEGHYEGKHHTVNRADWDLLNAYWTDNLIFALPFFSSFIARNTLTFHTVVPRLPVEAKKIWVFSEQESELPFAPLIEAAAQRYAAAEPRAVVVPVKSIYYAREADIEPYIVERCIGNRGADWDTPKAEHLCSAAFSFETWQRVVAAQPAST